MADFTGTSGDDDITGTVDLDTFDMTQGGKDRVKGLESDDTFNFGSKLTAGDRIDGGTGHDTVTINGNYSAGLVFTASTMKNVEQMNLGSGHSYDFTLVDANTSGEFLVSGTSLAAGDSLRFDGSADTDTEFDIISGAGDDIAIGGAGNDGFVLGAGNDTGAGGAGVDNFVMQGFFSAGDALDGGADTDFIGLMGDYTGGLTISKTMMKNIEVMQLQGAFDYDLTFENKVVASGASLAILTIFIDPGHTVSIDAHAARVGNFALSGTAGDDTLLAGGGIDSFNLTGGGDDVADGGKGNDEFAFDAAFTRQDRVNGGQDHDIVRLNGDYSAGVVFGALTMSGFEELIMEAGHSYGLTTHDNTVAAGATMGVFASSLGLADILSFDGSHELDGAFHVEGGAGDDFMLGGGDGAGDTLIGNGGEDNLNGGRGADQIFGGTENDLLYGDNGDDFLEGGDGDDTYLLLAVSESTGAGHDLVSGFNSNFDAFDLSFAVTGVDSTVGSGSMSAASFDADLEAALGKPELHRSHAVLFVPDSGDLAGDIFLVIDANNHAGYDAGEDFVVEMVNGIILNFTTDNFI